MQRRLALALLSPLVVGVVACGSDTPVDNASNPSSTEPTGTELPAVEPSVTNGDAPVAQGETFAPDTIVFVWSEDGGCAQMGPNCARYEVAFDGTVATYRSGGAEVEASGTVDAQLVTDWMAAVDDLDVVALQERVGVGEMTAAFDGTDIVVQAPHADLELSSVDTRFDNDESIIAAGLALAIAAQTEAQLELQQR